MPIFDAHLDLAWNALEWNRNLELPVREIRRFEQHFDGEYPGPPTVSFPELRRAGIGIVIATLLPRLHRRASPLTFYQSREAAHAAALGQLAYYRAMCRKGVLRELSTGPDLRAHADLWMAWESGDQTEPAPPIGFVLSMEGARRFRLRGRRATGSNGASASLARHITVRTSTAMAPVVAAD
ncbi:MAG: hypothetical protein R3B90_11130 [Planctomycetaceae bacterium]